MSKVSLSLCMCVCVCVCVYVWVCAHCRLEVVENAWTGEVISLSQDGDATEDYYVNENRNIDPGSEAGRGRDRNYFGKYSWTLPL